MKRVIPIVLVFAFLAGVPLAAGAREYEERDLSGFFRGYHGAFIMLDAGRDKYVLYNKEQSEKRLSPCSTFKVLNSLIGLETGVIKDRDFPIKWNGKKYPFEAWNRDHSLQSAISNSVVWYYRELASRVGEERMRKYIRAAGYGNEDISGGIDRFWLQSSLKISAKEQVDFLYRLFRDELPFSQRSMDITKSIIRLAETDDFLFHGKTGSGFGEEIDGKPKTILGWFVGCVVRKDQNRAFIFAVNIEAEDGAGGKKAGEIAELVLKEMGVF